MQVNECSLKLIQDLYFHFGSAPELLEEILSCQFQDVAKKEFSLREIISITEKLGVSLEDLVDGKVNWTVVKRRLIDEDHQLPDDYSINAGSHMSTVRSMLSFIAFKFNQETHDEVLRMLNLTPSLVMNDSLKLNNAFINDLFTIFTERFSLTRDDINLMSIMVHRYSMRNSVLQMAKTCQSEADVLGTMIKNAAKYELNFDYSIEQRGRDSFIYSRSKFELDERSSMKDPLLWFKLCTFKNITHLMGRRPMDLRSYEVERINGFQHLKIRIANTLNLSSNQGFFRHQEL